MSASDPYRAKVTIDWDAVVRALATAPKPRQRRLVPRDEITAYEHQQRFELPSDLRELYARVGEGGVIRPLDVHAEIARHAEGWGRDGPAAVRQLLGPINEPFPYVDDWNLDGVPLAELEETSPGDTDQIAARYWAPLSGAFPFARVIDEMDTWLILTGDACGTVWDDARIEHRGLLPWRGPQGEQMSFEEWLKLFVRAERGEARLAMHAPRRRRAGR